MDGPGTLNAIELMVGLLGLAGLVAIVARPLRLPYTVALVVAGLVFGAVATAVGVPAIEVTPELVLIALLPGLVFEAAYRLRLDELRRWLGGLVLLAVPGVLISAAVVAIVLNVATGLRPDLAFLVGAMVSATDPAAVVATFKPLRVAPALSTMVDGESLLNDGTGLVLFAIALQAVVLQTSPLDATLGFVEHGGPQRCDRRRDRVAGDAAHQPDRRPPARADDLGRARLRQLPASPTSSTSRE